jgi:hypothetical protein
LCIELVERSLDQVLNRGISRGVAVDEPLVQLSHE